MKILVVGMNPSGRDLKHKTGPTLLKLQSWMDNLSVQYFSFINCIDKPGSVKLSDVDIDFMQKASKDYHKIIALGNFASTALKAAKVSHFKMPHPSPLNRLLNDKKFENKILSACKDYLR